MFTGPASPEEFDRLIPDEDAAERLLVKVRWPEGVCCPRCGSRELTRLDKRRRWQCKPCRLQPSARSASALHKTRLPLRLIVEMVWLATQRGWSTNAISRQVGIRYATVFDIIHKMRGSLAERGVWLLDAPPESPPVHVGVAEIPAPKRANGDPPHRPPVPVGLAVEEAPAPPALAGLRFTVALAPDASDADLLARTQEQVVPGAAVRVEPDRMTLHPLRRRASRVLEEEVRCLQVWLMTRFGGVSRRYLPNYLAQYAYRLNRCHRKQEMFGWVLRRMMVEPCRPTSDLALTAP